MKKIFSKESKFTSFLQNVADLMILNVLTIVCSLPIITIGASYTAMHYVLTKWDDDKKIARDFLDAWKNNFRQATIIWVAYLAVFGIILYDFYLIKELSIGTNATYVTIVIAAILFFTLGWTFILQSRYENTIFRTIKNALILSFIQLKYTLAIALLYVLPFVIAYFFPPTIPTIFLLGVATAGYFQRRFYKKVFEKIEHRDDENNCNENKEDQYE